MKLEKLINQANALAKNNLSITRYGSYWEVYGYGIENWREHKVKDKIFRQAIIIFIASFRLKIEKPKGKK